MTASLLTVLLQLLKALVQVLLFASIASAQNNLVEEYIHDMAAAMDLSDWEADPRLFLFTSLTAGSSHIITATSRLETILKANRIPFQAIDTATEEKARKLWGRRAGKRKLPGLVKEGYVVGVRTASLGHEGL